MEEREKIKLLLTSDFELNLFEASMASLEENNKLRFNNFAYAIRELSRHILHRLAPEANVKACSWFKHETNGKKPTRTQRIKYAIQGGIDDSFLQSWGFDVIDLRETIKDIKETIDMLSKYTHINEEVFDIADEKVKEMVDKVLGSLIGFVEKIESYRSTLKSYLEDHIDDHMVDTVISNSYVNIDSLAPHYSLNYGEVTDFHISEINDKEIIVDVSGNIYVTLEYGSRQERREGDGLDLDESFNYETKIRYEIGADFPPANPEVDEFDVDTSSWYDEGEL